MADSFAAALDHEKKSQWSLRDLFVLTLAAAMLVGFRLHAFSLPLETDECNYAYIGSRLLAGDRLYVDVWDHQPPGVFALFASIIAIFGDNPFVFRWMAMAFSLASMIFLYAIAKRIGGIVAAITAAFLFALSSSDPGAAGEGCNREIYMNTLILCSWWLALRVLLPLPRRERAGVKVEAEGVSNSVVESHDSRMLVRVFLAGAALALASSLKTNVAIHWLFLCIVIAFAAIRRQSTGHSFRRAATVVFLFGLAPAILWSGTFLYFAMTSRWHEFVDAVFTFNLAYSDASQDVLQRFGQFFTPVRHPFVFESALALWLIGGAATLWLAIETILRKSLESAFVLVLILAGYVATCLPGWFWPHYYYLMIPALALACAVLVGRIADIPLAFFGADIESTQVHKLNVLWRFLSCLIIAAVTAAVAFTEVRHYLLQPPFGITVKRYNSRDFWGRGQGENVAKVTDPGDRIFVFGNDASIYYYAHRLCASRYTMITGLHAGYPGIDERRKILLDELTRDPPRLIIVVSFKDTWEEWVAFLHQNYSKPIGWDFRDGTRNEPIMFVLARKEKPVPEIDWNWDRSSVGGWIPKHGTAGSL